MRLSDEKIKQGLHHADVEVRTSVAEYFGNLFSPDTSIMPDVIEAIAKYDLEAFSFYMFLEEMVTTDDVMRWAIAEIIRVGLLENWHDSDYVDCLGQAILYADNAIVQRHAAMIEAAEEIDDLLKECVAWRIQLNEGGMDALWREFNDYCDQIEKDDDPIPDLVERDRLIVASLKQWADPLHDRVLALLVDDTTDSRRTMAVRLAGDLRLKTAVPHLLNLFPDSDEAMFEELCRALAKIDQEVAVKEISVRFHDEENESRAMLAVFLKLIHTDQSVQTCRQLLDEEQDEVVHAKLLEAVLLNFSTAGIEPARKFILGTAKSPSVLSVRETLFIACKVMGETFPEFDAWQEDMKNDVAFRQEWAEENDDFLLDLSELNGTDEEMDEDLDEFFDDDLDEEFNDVVGEDEFEEEQPAMPSATFVREQPHVGRNDPCPCGSGKKFKKCCYRKGETGE